MGFGYLLLAVKSEQDNYLIGNPQFTFFKAVYRKHTNFAMDYQFINFLGDTTNAFGRKLYVDIPKNGDLLHRMYLTIDITNTTVTQIAPLAYNFIEYIDILIGGQRIDRHYGEWFAIWHELMEDSSKSIALANMVGVQNNNTTGKTLTIPLRFWFNNDIGLALPLIALQYNDIKLEIKFNGKSELEKFTDKGTADNTLNITNIQLIAEYIHLDKEERRLFSSTNHEYLITQVQESLNNSINNFAAKYTEGKTNFERQRHKIDLRFTYPVKELFWTIQDVLGNMNSATVYNNTGAFKYNYWNNYESGNDQMSMCNLILNGKDLTEELPANFYRDIQQYQYHNGYGINFIESSGTPAIDFTKGTGVYSYSFALNPKDFQPSGSLNFSKLESCQLKFGLIKDTIAIVAPTNVNKTINIYAVNYNVLRIMSGMAGLAFIN
jgi:hypothetical protein